MQTKLPVNQKNITFLAEGEFFLNSILFEIRENGLFPKESSVERISRFSDSDLQKHIASSVDTNILLFSRNFEYRSNPNWSYIKREKTLERVSFDILARIYGVETITALNIGFKDIAVFQYSRNKKELKVRAEKINTEGVNTSLKNNFLFDPEVSFAKKTKIADIILKVVAKLVKDIQRPDLFVLMGEFIWVNSSKFVLEEILQSFFESKKYEKRSGFDLLIDENGLWEGLLSELPEETELKFLNKENFFNNLIRIENLGKEKTIEIQSGQEDVSNRELHANYKDWIYSKLGDKEKFRDRKYSGIIFGRADKVRHFPKLSKKVRLRTDYALEYVDASLTIKSQQKKDAAAIKIFEYSSPNPFARLKLDVIDGERVKQKQRLCKYHEIGGLIDKYKLSPIDGRVDLSNLKRGYIQVIDESQKKEIRKYSSYYKIRPKLILGNSWEGKSDGNTIYISKLYKTDFEMFVQKSKKVIFAESIDQKLFNDIVDFDLGTIVTVVILTGIDVDTNFAFKVLQKEKTSLSVNSVLQEIKVGSDSDLKRFSRSKRPNLRLNQNVRIINAEHWGECATIVSVKNGEVGVNTNVHIDQVSPINLI